MIDEDIPTGLLRRLGITKFSQRYASLAIVKFDKKLINIHM